MNCPFVVVIIVLLKAGAAFTLLPPTINFTAVELGINVVAPDCVYGLLFPEA